jgi:uncharacterized protein (DUF302 family)
MDVAGESMSDFGWRLILDYPFDRALWSVIDALVREGFAVEATNLRALVQAADRDTRRYVVLHAIHPEMSWETLKLDLDAGVLLPCQLAIYELASGQTVVVANGPMAEAVYTWRGDHPTLTRIALDLAERMGRALHLASHGGVRSPNAA